MTKQVLGTDDTPSDGQQPAHLRNGKIQSASGKRAVERESSKSVDVVDKTS
jgi:hypothetical protein